MRGLGGLQGPRIAIVVACVLASVVAGSVLSLVLRGAGGPPSSITSPAISTPGISLVRQHAPPFTLLDQNGKSVSLSSEKGHVVLLTFLDPQCRQLCPLMGKDIGAVEKQLPSSIHPVLLIVSVAPGRTQADVATFLSKETPGWLPGWHWLLGPDEVSLKLVWAAWHITVIPTPTDIAHDTVLDIIDPAGYLRVTYPAPLAIPDVVHAITTIASG
jgi:cytochrome oxidase Cu insertion factor (SCO1/SenC/PrrC family)